MSGDLEAELSELANAAASGDQAATERLIRAMHGPLFRTLYFLGVAETHLDDLAQDTVIQMYRSLARYDRARPFLPWMRSIASHVAANHRRSRGRERANLGQFRRYAERLAERDDPIVCSPPSRDHLEDCIERLPPKQREVLSLCYFEGRTSDEISELISSTPAAVRQVLSRLRGALRTCIEAKAKLGLE